jgi:preprotein translocase subunit SecG
VFGRQRQHHWLGSDGHARATNVVVWVLGALFLALLLVAAVSALAG